jgi:hypothetical protein
MPSPASPADRHEPLPGLLGLPAHFWRKLPPAGRRAAVIGGALLLAAAVMAGLVLGPRIAETRRENEAQERREQARVLAAERARLAAEQRPRRGTLDAAAPAARVATLERAITRDAHARNRAGELNNEARRTDCRKLGRERGRLLLACTAVTSETEAVEGSSPVLVGYPYRAALTEENGRYAFCKISGRPGEGSFVRPSPVELPRACG